MAPTVIAVAFARQRRDQKWLGQAGEVPQQDRHTVIGLTQSARFVEKQNSQVQACRDARSSAARSVDLALDARKPDLSPVGLAWASDPHSDDRAAIADIPEAAGLRQVTLKRSPARRRVLRMAARDLLSRGLVAAVSRAPAARAEDSSLSQRNRERGRTVYRAHLQPAAAARTTVLQRTQIEL